MISFIFYFANTSSKKGRGGGDSNYRDNQETETYFTKSRFSESN